MSRSLKVRQTCFDLLRLSIKRNGFPSQRAFAEEAGYSLATVKKFLGGKPVDFATFTELCQTLNLDWQTIADLPTPSPSQLPESFAEAPVPVSPQHQPQASNPGQYRDWGGAVDISCFYGRSQTLAILEQWLIDEQCQLVALHGIGGIGKTTLSLKLAHLIQDEFDVLIWRSLKNAPPVQETLTMLLQFFQANAEHFVAFDSQSFGFQGANTEMSDIFGHQLRQLVGCLRDRRCLVILDNAESLFQAGDRAGTYRPGYEGYGQFFKIWGETTHRSSLLLTSRELPKEITLQAGESSPVRCFQLSGLSDSDGRALLQDKDNLTGSNTEWATLIQAYSGNPLALKMIAAAVRDYFDGSISSFLTLGQQDSLVFGDIRQLLVQQVERLLPLEIAIMYWLAINREPLKWQSLQADLVKKVPLNKILLAIDSLERRSLLEKDQSRITQQAVIMDYFTTDLIDQICQEIQQQKPVFLRSHALMKATVNVYIREAQSRFLVAPIVARLRSEWPSIEALSAVLANILALERDRPIAEMGYVGGNILTLLRHLQVDLQGYDFSRQTVWQAYLQGMNLHNVSFAGSDLSHSIFNQPFGSIRTLAFSPDGQVLATGDTNCEIWLWQIAPRDPLSSRSLPSGPASTLSAGDIGPHILTFQGHCNWVMSVAFSPDGQLLASGSADRTIKLWQVSTGECLQTFQGHRNWVMSVAFSPDGQLLASGSADRTIKLWQVNTGEAIQTFEGHDHGIWSVAFSPNAKALVSGSADCTLKLWDIQTRICQSTFLGHRQGVWSVAFSPDGRSVASGSADQTIKLWDLQTEKCLQTLKGHNNWVWVVAFSPDGNSLASGSADQSLRLWSLETGECLRVFSGHSNWVWSVAFSPQGDYLVSGSEDRTMRLWELSQGQCLKVLQGNSNWVWSVAFSSQGEYLASGQGDRLVHLWDAKSGQVLANLSGAQQAIWSVAFSPDGTLLASGNEDGSVHLWPVSTNPIAQITADHSGRHGLETRITECHSLMGHTQAIWTVAFSPQEHYLASGSADQTIKIWEITHPERPNSLGRPAICRKILTGHQHWVSSVAFHPQRNILASGSHDRAIKLWDLDTGQCLETWTGHTSGLWCIAFSPKGDYLVSSSTDQTVRLWSVDTGQCQQILQGHENWVMSVAVSPNGQYIASGSADHTIKLWDVNSGDCICTFTGHYNSVWSVAFSPDGTYLASGSDDKTIKLWSVETKTCLKTLKTKEFYEGMDITGIVGLTDSEISTLQQLGAINHLGEHH